MEEFQYCSAQFHQNNLLRNQQQLAQNNNQQYNAYNNQLHQDNANNNVLRNNTALRCNIVSTNETNKLQNSNVNTNSSTYNSIRNNQIISPQLNQINGSNNNNNNTNNNDTSNNSMNNLNSASSSTQSSSIASTASVVYAMDRLSPYNNYEDGRNGNSLASLGYNPSDDHTQESLLLLNQNLECLKQSYNVNSSTNNSSSSNNSNNANSNSNNNASTSPSTSTLSNLSNLDVNNQLSASPTSSSPSSSTDANSTYGTLANSILNGTLTPPPDSGASSLTNDSLGSNNLFNPFSVKVENIRQILDCNGHISQQQQQHQQQQAAQHQHSHHQQQNLKQTNNLLQNPSLEGTTLVSLVPATSTLTLLSDKSQSLVNSSSSSTPTGLNTMLQQVVPNQNGCVNIMNLLSPSKPTNISELSNSSLISSSSSGNSTIDSSSGMTGGNLTHLGSTSKRTRTSKQSSEMGKDGKYFERRKRNNVAAKKSRDARKQREDEIAIRASFLEKENSILKAQLQTLKDEAQQLRILLAQKKSSSLGAPSNCSNCANCSPNCSKQNNMSLLNSAYTGNPGLSSLASQLNGYDHSDPLVGLDKQHQVALSSPNSANLANASIYLQHQNSHRHQII